MPMKHPRTSATFFALFLQCPVALGYEDARLALTPYHALPWYILPSFEISLFSLYRLHHATFVFKCDDPM